MTRQERFVWRLATKLSGPEKLAAFKKIGFWMGYYFFLMDHPEYKWDELETVLMFNSLDILRMLGYFDTMAGYEKLIGSFESTQAELTLEDVLITALKHQGPRQIKPLLYLIVSKLEAKALSQRFYQYFIYLSLTGKYSQ